MNILFLNTNIGYGGASKQMVWLANRFSNEGYDVTFLTFRDKTENQVIGQKVKHIHLQLEDVSGHRGSFFHTVFSIRSFIKNGHFDWAIAFLSPSQLRLSLACKGLPVRLLYSHRGDPYYKAHGLRNIVIDKLTSWAFRQADFFVFQTGRAKERFSIRIQRRSSVIANSIVPLKRTCPRKGNIEKSIVNVARLDISQKRQDLLITAFQRISNDYPDYHLLIYGDGSDEEKLKELAGGDNRIIFKGKTSNVAEAIQNATMFVLTSDFEGIPNALLEAMSLGVPCISTDCSPGGAAMIICNNDNGLLVPCNNVNALSCAISFFIEHFDAREAMGQRGRQVCVTFSEDVVFSQWKMIIDTVQ